MGTTGLEPGTSIVSRSAAWTEPDRRVSFMIIALLIAAVVTVVASFPATWLLMLFLGNVGLTQIGFWGALPLGILVSFLLGAASSRSRRDY